MAVNNNSIENTIDATVDGDTTYAKKVSVEARDGKLSVDEAENPYMDTLNSVSASVDKEDTVIKMENHWRLLLQ